MAFAGTILAFSVGGALGLISGYVGGSVDALIMRSADMMRSFPFIILAIAIFAVTGGGVTQLILFLGIWAWSHFARLLRGKVLSVRENEYIQAARSIGAGPVRIMVRHILPNSLGPMWVLATFFLATMIIVESSLSFLGFGISPPQASWGNMLSDGRQRLEIAWWMSVAPGLAIMLTVLAANIVGDYLREALDPRMRGV